MSYDFSLRIPVAQRKPKRKSGPHPEQLQRLQRAREILLAFEPGIAIDDDETMFTAHSVELGEVFVEADRISLALSLGAEPRAIYTAIHGLMKRFHTEGYEVIDPQINGDIAYAETFPDFMRQYRSHFPCTDDEFDQWCRGETPPAWAERHAERERGNTLAAAHMPREWPLMWNEQQALSDDELWKHLQDVVQRNDAAIAEHGLAGYLRMLSDEKQQEMPQALRRLDGSWYPNSLVPWYQGLLLHYEATTLAALSARGHRTALRDQPQRVTVTFELPPETPIDNAHHEAVRATMHPIYPLLKDAGLIAHGVDASARGNTWEYVFYGEDADAMADAVVAQLDRATRVRPTRITKRYGSVGAREVDVPSAVGTCPLATEASLTVRCV